MDELLLSGEIPAAIGVQVDSPDIKPLIPNARDAGVALLRERGIWPINHTVVIKDELLHAHPELAADLFHAFAEAKTPYLRRLADGAIAEPSKDDDVFKRVMDVIGDPLPYGVAPNRRMLETVMQYAVEQGIIGRPIAIEELFPASTHGLTG
jgi:4,5-dihydroxyphthalate decarboxylase